MYPSPHISTKKIGLFTNGTLSWVDNDGNYNQEKIKTGLFVSVGLFCSYGCQLFPKTDISIHKFLIGMVLHLKSNCPVDYINEIRMCTPNGSLYGDTDKLIIAFLSFKLKYEIITLGDMFLLTTLLGGHSTAGYRMNGVWWGVLGPQINANLNYYYDEGSDIVKERLGSAQKFIAIIPRYKLVEWIKYNVFFISDVDKEISDIVNAYEMDFDKDRLNAGLKKKFKKYNVVNWSTNCIEKLLHK